MRSSYVGAGELVRKWQAMLRKETRGMDIQIRDIQRCAVGA